MVTSKECCVIAIPANAYAGMNRKDVVRSYEKMAVTDFEKQFETDDVLEFAENECSIYMQGSTVPLVRKVAPYTTFKSWGGKETRGSSMVSAIYTWVNGTPFAEYCAIRNMNPNQLDIAGDLVNFYKRYGWDAKEYDWRGLLPPFKRDNVFPANVELTVMTAILYAMRQAELRHEGLPEWTASKKAALK